MNKQHNVLYWSIIGVLLCIVGLPVQAQECEGIEVLASSLNVRTGASTSYSKVGRINKGEKYVTVAEQGNWKKIWFAEQARWIYAKYYTKSMTINCGSVVNTNSLNVRTGASTNYTKAGTMPKGSEWAIIGESGAWRKVWYKSEARWVHGYYLDGNNIADIEVDSFTINNNAASSDSRYVTVFAALSEMASYYQISENSYFSGAEWKPYSDDMIAFTLSEENGEKTVYFRVKNADGRISNTASDSIELAVQDTKAYRIDRDLFFSNIRSQFGSLKQSQVNGLNFLLENIELDEYPAINNFTVWARQIAYMLATTKHEVANTYTPITEYSNTTCKRYDGGCTYKGRGYVQLTHKYNYQNMGDILGVDLVSYPGLALDPDIAYNVMSYGMFYGIFTGRTLGRYIKQGKTDYYNARRVINGLDKASLIKGYAKKFQTILTNSVK